MFISIRRHRTGALSVLLACALTTLSVSKAAAQTQNVQTQNVQSQNVQTQSLTTQAWARADAQARLGQLTDAERTLRTLVRENETPDPGTAMRLGWVLAARGETVAAAELLTSAETAVAQLSSPDRVQLRFAQGLLAVRTQNYIVAESWFDRAAVEAKSAGATADELRAQIDSLRARLDSRKIASLEQRLQQALAAAMRLPRSDESARLLGAVGELHRRAINEFRSPVNLRRDAFTALQRARDYAETNWSRAYATGLLGALYEDEARTEEATRLTSQAVFLAQAAGAQDQLYRWEWQAARLERRRGELARSSLSLDRALNSLAGIRNDLLQSSRQAFVNSIEPLYLDYADVNLQRAAALPAGGDEQQRLLRDVRSQLESLKQAEIQDYFENECVADDAARRGRAFDIPGTAVVYPIPLADRLEVLVETGGTLRRFSTKVSRGEMTAMTRRLRIGLERSSAGEAYVEPSRALHRWLLADAEPWLATQRVTTLVFVPSGALRTIPLGALHDGRQFLIERYAIATTPAISLLTSLDKANPERLLLGGLTQGVQGFSELPSVAEEMRTVATIFPAQSFRDETFSLSAVESQLTRSEYSVAHLATHGEFNADHRRSFLLTYDNRLTMDGLKSALGQRGKALDLLVLSACRTAAGDDRAALGLAGVALQAGAKSALASLWYISDEATAELMTNFYRNLKQGQTSKAQSLQNAQVGLLKSPQYQHPSFWAPFLLIGSWL